MYLLEYLMVVLYFSNIYFFLELQAVRNIKHNNEQVDSKKGITSASQCEGDKAVFTLTGKLAVLVFNIKIQAQSRG